MAQWSLTELSSVTSFDRIDGEYYLPEYISNQTTLSKIETVALPQWFLVSDGNHLSISKYFSDSCGIPYFRGQDINDFFLENAHPIKIPKKVYEKPIMRRSYFLSGDVLLSIVGTIGSMSLVPDTIAESTGSCKIAILRSKGNCSPFFLAAYLMSKYGQLQIKRNTRGAVQMGLILKDLSRIRIPEFSDAHQAQIETLVKNSININRQSKTLYSQAQQLLELELGLNKLSFQKPMGYTAKFSELEQSHRSDAEFFHTKYEPFLSAVRGYRGGWSTLKQFTNRALPNFNGKGHSEDYEYVEIGDINVGDGAYTSSRVPAKQLPANAKIILNGGEILISQVRPTRGAIAIIDDNLSYSTICSGAFYVCTANDPNQREAVWLYLRIIRAVFEKYCGGTSYPTIESNYIAKFPVPIFQSKLALRVRELVLKSKAAKKESQRLIVLAKTRVEQLIEEAVRR